MKKYAKLALTIIVGFSLFKIFSVEDALIEFLIIGKLPGLNVQLNMFTTLILIGITLYALNSWFKSVIHEFTEFRLEANKKAETDRIAAQQAIESNADETPAQSEVTADDLEILTPHNQ